MDGGCERDERQPVGYFTFGFPDRYIDDGELVQYLLAFQSAEIGTDLLNATVSLKAVFADSEQSGAAAGWAPRPRPPVPIRTDSPTCARRLTPTRRLPWSAASAVMSILDSPKIYGRIPAGTTLTPAFTIQASMPNAIQKRRHDRRRDRHDRPARASRRSSQSARPSTCDEVSLYYSTDFPTGGTESVGGYDINNNEVLETVTYDPRNFFTDYFYETRTYSDLTSTNPTLVALEAPWNFDTLTVASGTDSTTQPPAADVADGAVERGHQLQRQVGRVRAP